MHDAHVLALKFSMRSFFNSYLRDTGAEYSEKDRSFIIPIQERKLNIGISKFSQMGCHEYSGQISLQAHSSKRDLTFFETVEILCGNDSEVSKRVQDSLNVMTLMFQERLERIKMSFLEAEQGLITGHNFHPCPKSRVEFTIEDSKFYSPEYKGSFNLEWFFIDESLVWKETAKNFSLNWSKTFEIPDAPANFTLYPMHPWQSKKLLENKYIQGLVLEGRIIPIGKDSRTWYATSSLRSIYAPELPYMLKFSMSVKVTNSIRHMQVGEVVRGMRVKDYFDSEIGKEMTRTLPQFSVMQEPLCMGIKGDKGEVLPETIVLVRENCFKTGEEEAVVLATLIQEHPYFGRETFGQFLKKHGAEKWFNEFLDKSIKPLLVAHANFGIMLGAHQQNLIIKLRDGLPEGSIFRDCQGTGLSLLAFESFKNKEQIEGVKELVVPKELSIVLFSYYLVINSVMSTLSAVASESEESEELFINIFRSFLIQLEGEVKDKSVIHYLLNSPFLLQKGNFRCVNSRINENTIDDPLSIYNQFKNPFFLEANNEL